MGSTIREGALESLLTMRQHILFVVLLVCTALFCSTAQKKNKDETVRDVYKRMGYSDDLISDVVYHEQLVKQRVQEIMDDRNKRSSFATAADMVEPEWLGKGDIYTSSLSNLERKLQQHYMFEETGWPLLSASQVGEVNARILFLKSVEELAGKADHTAQ